MVASAVICEFNPLHSGHEYIIRRMKEASDCVICIMSGSFVQRGEVAIADPYLRAQIAIRAGADIVLELPFPWSASSAESFAEAGVNIAHRVGCDLLFFGSESGDAEFLKSAAEATLSPNFAENFTQLSKTALGTTAAFTRAVALTLGVQDLQINANDLLGISYMRAIQKQGLPLCPVTIKRLGDGFNADTVSGNGYPSATALRRLMREACEDTYALRQILDCTMPSDALDILISQCENGNVPADMDRLGAFIHAYYRLADAEELEKYAEMSGGLALKICRAAKETADFNSFFYTLRNRHHTDAHLRRALLFGITRVEKKDLAASPAYTTLLAASRKGCEYLKSIKKSSDIEIVTKPADAPEGRQQQLAHKADSLFTLSFPTPKDAAYLLRSSPYIES